MQVMYITCITDLPDHEKPIYPFDPLCGTSIIIPGSGLLTNKIRQRCHVNGIAIHTYNQISICLSISDAPALVSAASYATERKMLCNPGRMSAPQLDSRASEVTFPLWPQARTQCVARRRTSIRSQRRPAVDFQRAPSRSAPQHPAK